MATAPITPAPAPTITVPTKAAVLDQDRTMPLTEDVALTFATHANMRFGEVETIKLLGDRAKEYAAAIDAEPTFPFTAQLLDGRVSITYVPDKTPGATLKNLSDGVTHVYKAFHAKVGLEEGDKFSLSMILQPAMYKAYLAAGLDTGPHTGYFWRGC